MVINEKEVKKSRHMPALVISVLENGLVCAIGV